MSSNAHRSTAAETGAVGRDREFRFTDRDFRQIRDFAAEHTGIVLSDGKRDMVYSRLSRRLRELGLVRFAEYLRLLSSDTDELGRCINALTTNLTSFFREAHHFEYLANSVIPELAEDRERRRIRIWSAGCSTGEEPYSLAMTLRDSVPDDRDWDTRILATDLDSEVVARGRTGVYTQERVQGLDKARTKRWFRRGIGNQDGLVRVAADLQQLITFKQLNLLRDWPVKGPFDAIFCRNVVIYFNKDTQRRLFDRFADLLSADGYLFIGHSESLFKVTDRFELIGETIYRRKY